MAMGEARRADAGRGRPARHRRAARSWSAAATSAGKAKVLPRGEFVATIAATLDDDSAVAVRRAPQLRERRRRVKIDSLERVRSYFTPKNEERPEIHGGLAYCHFVESPEMDEKLKELKVTVRCMPLDAEEEPGKCIFTGQPSTKRGVFAKAY